jgi:hypothetical protein
MNRNMLSVKLNHPVFAPLHNVAFQHDVIKHVIVGQGYIGSMVYSN